MPDALAYALMLALLVFGLACLALATERHWRQLRPGTTPAPGTARLLRVMGSAALACSLALCLVLDHASIAALVWIMAMVPAALAVTFTFSWRARWFAPLLTFVRD